MLPRKDEDDVPPFCGSEAAPPRAPASPAAGRPEASPPLVTDSESEPPLGPGAGGPSPSPSSARRSLSGLLEESPMVTLGLRSLRESGGVKAHGISIAEEVNLTTQQLDNPTRD